MVDTSDIPEKVVDVVEEGVDKQGRSVDPARISYVLELREAYDADLPKSYNDDSDAIYYYEIRSGDMDMGYDNVYYGLVYYYESGEAKKRKLGDRPYDK